MLLLNRSAMLQRLVLATLFLGLAAYLAACAAAPRWASDDAVMAARHVHGGAPELTLVTIMNYRSGRGDHASLFINGTERVLYDPAGKWELAEIPERNDLHFGITSVAGASYYLSHVRDTHYAVVQRLQVSPEIARQAKQIALSNGPIGPARCAATISALLQQMDGFESIGRTWFPHHLMNDFAQIPGVQRHELHHDTPDLLEEIYRVQQPL